MKKINPDRINLQSIFLGLQTQMKDRFKNFDNVAHPTAKGDLTELAWTALLNDYLPKRYQAAKAFVLDSRGRLSRQIDIVIFDRQYSPFLFNQDNALYIPAESVYAVFEVKQSLTRQIIDYAEKKAASVRALTHTSAPIPHAGGTYKPKKCFNILAGLLAVEAPWNIFSRLEQNLNPADPQHRLDLGCILNHGAFELNYPSPTAKKYQLTKSNPETALIFFFLRLIDRLQTLGTVPAINIPQYAKAINFSTP